jgi:hypothetical protein
MRNNEHFGGFRRQLKKPSLHPVFGASSAIVQIQMIRQPRAAQRLISSQWKWQGAQSIGPMRYAGSQ